jgi:hypothetical protein
LACRWWRLHSRTHPDTQCLRSSRAWIVPVYTMPVDAEHMVVMHVVDAPTHGDQQDRVRDGCTCRQASRQGSAPTQEDILRDRARGNHIRAEDGHQEEEQHGPTAFTGK